MDFQHTPTNPNSRASGMPPPARYCPAQQAKEAEHVMLKDQAIKERFQLECEIQSKYQGLEKRYNKLGLHMENLTGNRALRFLDEKDIIVLNLIQCKLLFFK